MADEHSTDCTCVWCTQVTLRLTDPISLVKPDPKPMDPVVVERIRTLFSGPGRAMFIGRAVIRKEGVE